MASILEKIADQKKAEVAQAKRQFPLNTLAFSGEATRDFVQALRAKNPAIIAEIKKASPSKGIIRPDFNVSDIATIYANNGAACLSVLTDKPFFQGALDYLRIAKAECTLPVLRKDFIIDPYQIYESKAHGADCILLIVALLDDVQLHDFCQLAKELNMAVLVESHTREELLRALPLPTPLMGINNRSLHTFQTTLSTSQDLSKLVPTEKMVITESGINNQTDIKAMQAVGIQAFLIGESLMRARDIGTQLQLLLQN